MLANIYRTGIYYTNDADLRHCAYVTDKSLSLAKLAVEVEPLDGFTYLLKNIIGLLEGKIGWLLHINVIDALYKPTCVKASYIFTFTKRVY